MGRGAFVTIRNQASVSVTISYSGFTCMHQNGESNSNFGPISGTIAPGSGLGRQYIEAIGGLCFSTSTFTMHIQGAGATLAIPFRDSSNAFTAALPIVAAASLAASATVTKTRNGNQDEIDVVVQDHGHATWMADAERFVRGRMLKELVIPGTHDSGSYAINVQSVIPPELRGLTPADQVGAAVTKWSKTQPIDFAAQLAAGIRYFDLRVIQLTEYWLHYKALSVRLSEALQQIKAFVDAHPKELVILDFNHLDQIRDNAALVQMLTDAFGMKLAPNTLTPSSTVDEFWRQGHSVIALYADPATVAANPSRLWPQSAISSPWADTTKLPVLHDFLNAALNQRAADSPQLFVLQGVLTPDASMILAGASPGEPGSIEDLAGRVTPQVLDWVRQWPARKLNIVIVDWFTVAPSYVDVLVNFNRTP